MLHLQEVVEVQMTVVKESDAIMHQLGFLDLTLMDQELKEQENYGKTTVLLQQMVDQETTILQDNVGII